VAVVGGQYAGPHLTGITTVPLSFYRFWTRAGAENAVFRLNHPYERPLPDRCEYRTRFAVWDARKGKLVGYGY
jgi:hypothetical protein